MSDTSTERKNNRNNYEKWCVLVVFVVLNMGYSMLELMFATIPKQTAAYYGIKAKYFEIIVRFIHYEVKIK